MRIAIVLLTAAAGCAARQTPAETPESVRVALTQAMPPLDGAHLEVRVVEVRYAPGAGSKPHQHTCPVVGYVIEGAFRSQVRGGPVQVFHAGESFYEPANGIHEISANASDREPVRFTATFLCDHAPPHTLDVTQ